MYNYHFYRIISTYVRQNCNNAQTFPSQDCILHIRFAVYFHRNAVRSNAGEDRTVPHTVPLWGGAMQTHARVCCFWHKIFHLDIESSDSPVFQTGTALKSHSFSHFALTNKWTNVIDCFFNLKYFWTKYEKKGVKRNRIWFHVLLRRPCFRVSSEISECNSRPFRAGQSPTHLPLQVDLNCAGRAMCIIIFPKKNFSKSSITSCQIRNMQFLSPKLKMYLAKLTN